MPGYPKMYYNLGRAYLEGGAFDKALDLYNPLISDYLKDSKVEAAEDLARQLAEADPSNDKAQQRLLDVLHQKGDREETPRVYRRLAAIYEAKGLPRNAVGALDWAVNDEDAATYLPQRGLT